MINASLSYNFNQHLYHIRLRSRATPDGEGTESTEGLLCFTISSPCSLCLCGKKVFSWIVRSLGVAITVVITLLLLSAQAASPFAELDRKDTVSGYLARLLINETAFPGERGFVSKSDSQSSLLAVLWVLHSRIQFIPQGYTQVQVAGVRSANIIDVITGAGGRRQCEGFYCDAAGKFVAAARVEARVQNLLRIANSGGKPGRFAELLNDAQGLARAYLQEGIDGADRFVDLKRANGIDVTGRAYSWMTDVGTWHPGGNFVSIPSMNGGALAGNRFFTLRKVPK